VLFDLDVDGQRLPALASPASWAGSMYDRRDGRFLYKSDAFVPTQPVHAATAVTACWSRRASRAVRTGRLRHDDASRLDIRSRDAPATRYIARSDAARWQRSSVRQHREQRRAGRHAGALDLRQAGRLRWQVKIDEPLIGGVLSTARG
jgi:hypothetical protein